jgi:hypothetical protein
MRRLVREGFRRLDSEMLRELIETRKGLDAVLNVACFQFSSWQQTRTQSWQRRALTGSACRRARSHRRAVSSAIRPAKCNVAPPASRSSDVAGFAVAIRRRDQESGSAPDRAPLEVERTEVELSQGDGLAIGISISGDVTDDVVAYLKHQAVPVRAFVLLRHVWNRLPETQLYEDLGSVRVR